MESTLNLKRSDFASEVGLFLGFGRGEEAGDPAWATNQQAAIDSCVNSGLRQFYFPPAIEGQFSAYDWSFLKPIAILTLLQDANTLLLPDDFGGIEGKITISADAGIAWWPLEVVGIGRIYSQESQFPTTTGRPQCVCIEPLKGTASNRSQRFQMHAWPIADQDYTLKLQYYLNPNCLTGAYPWAYGGAPHAETILESCLAIAEQRLDDAMTVHTAKFKERLLASINLDRRQKPQSMGYNGDNSDLAGREWPSRYNRFWDGQPISINGVTY